MLSLFWLLFCKESQVFHSSLSAPAYSTIHAATQQWSNTKLLCRGGKKAVVWECFTTFYLFQVIYLLPVFHPLKIAYTLDIFASSHANLEEILAAALISCQRKSLRFLLVIISFLPCS